MKTDLFFTDPHLGCVRTAHTTPASRVKLRAAGLDSVRSLIGVPHTKLICLGDLVDTYHNNETTLLQLLPLANQIGYCLAGNHDLVNIKDRKGSLELLRELAMLNDRHDVFSYVAFGEVGYTLFSTDNARYFCVPHHTDQALFEKALDMVEQCEELAWEDPRPSYLLLHCNYDNPFSKDNEISLLLTKERTRQLLEHFDYVVLGHEHNAKEDFRGRLIVLGNLFPTSFHDISDKRLMEVGEDGHPVFTPTWLMDDHYLEVDWRGLISNFESYIGDFPLMTPDLQFIRLTGDVEVAELKDLSQLIKGLWKDWPNLLMLRSDVKVASLMPEVTEAGDVRRLPELISAELKGSDLEPLWNELRGVI